MAQGQTRATAIAGDCSMTDEKISVLLEEMNRIIECYKCQDSESEDE